MSDLPGHDWGYLALPTSKRVSLQYTALATRIDSTPPCPPDSVSVNPNEIERGRKHRSPSQKTMLSRALEKANMAVLLDNAQNFEGATEAYSDACSLLEQIMRGSTGDEDRRKLEAISTTYTNRIVELRSLGLDPQKGQEKALPDRPLSNDTLSPVPFPSYDAEEEAPVVETAKTTKVTGRTSGRDQAQKHFLGATQISPRRQSLLPSVLDTGDVFDSHVLSSDSLFSENWTESAHRSSSIDTSTLEPDCIPPPLSVSPWKPSSPVRSQSRQQSRVEPDVPAKLDEEDDEIPNHSRDTSTESTSWLDTIDESGDSSTSSLHSRRSSFGTHQKRTPLSVGPTEAELSAAVDAVVQATYKDGYGVAESEAGDDGSDAGLVLKSRRNIELARQKVHEAEQEDLIRQQDEKVTRKRDSSTVSEYMDEEAEEEERLLEEMTKGYVMDDFHFGTQSKPALPHQSGSSGFSGRTWGSSHSSQIVATRSSTAVLAESTQAVTFAKIPPPHPPPAGALPEPPTATAAALPVPPAPSVPPPRPPSFGTSPGPGVRDRRLSGQNARQLKIETHSRRSSESPAKKVLPLTSQIPVSDEHSVPLTEVSQVLPTKAGPLPRPPVPQAAPAPPLTPLASVHSGSSLHSESPATPALTRTGTQEADEAVPASPARFMSKSALPMGFLRKNLSSSSLKMRSLSVATTETSEISPITPGSATFSITDARRGTAASAPAIPTPIGSVFIGNGQPAGAMNLFDDQICSPTTPSLSGVSISNPPLPLEPCPEPFLLRPFWLLRCLYQTIAHPRGGYLSTKLFVPRDVWRVKNVKIKGIDEKVAHCDLLSAALQKLAKVDTLDADAVLEEMQCLEVVLEQVRTSLQKKLGSEVGILSPAALLKASSAMDDAGGQPDAISSKGGNANTKSYLSSWKKLRSRSSGAGLTSSYSGSSSKDGSKDSLPTSSVPMTPNPTSRPHKRNLDEIQLTGPNANYMGALARLCDAAQVLDQVARQVEDPGLKYSSETHVGLEFSTRIAAEFFGFYICRFALNDIGLMLDKFIKRGSELVLA